MLTIPRLFGQYPYLLVIEYTVVSYEPSRHLPILNKEFPRLSSRVLELDATPHPPSFNVSLSVNTYAISNRNRIYLPKSIQMLKKLQIFRNFKPPYQSTYFTLNQIFVFIWIVRLYKEKFKSQINDCTLESVEKNAQGRFSKTGHMSSFGKLQYKLECHCLFFS